MEIKNLENLVVVIPARLGSLSLCENMLIDLAGSSVIQRTYLKALEACVGEVYVATDSKDIARSINNIGGRVIMIEEAYSTDTAVVYRAFQKILSDKKERVDYVISLQGNIPLINSNVLWQLCHELFNTDFDVIAAVTRMTHQQAISSHKVKVVFDNNKKALYFSRSVIPFGASEYWYNVGAYAFRFASLDRFMHMKSSCLDSSEDIEHLRAMYYGMSVGVCIVETPIISICTMEDLECAKQFLGI